MHTQHTKNPANETENTRIGIEKYTYMDPLEETKQIAMEKIIQTGSLYDKQKLVDEIIDLPLEKLYRLHTNSTIFRDFCEAQTSSYKEEWDTNSYQRKFDLHSSKSSRLYIGEYHFKKWLIALHSEGHYGFTIKTMDKKECSTLSQYIAAYFFKKHLELENSDTATATFLLNEAARLGLFAALFKRCNNNEATLRDTAVSTKVKALIIKTIEEDADKMHNIYWSAGYEFASLTLMRVGTDKSLMYLDEQLASDDIKVNEEEIMEDDGSAPFYKKAVENFCYAQLLEEDIHSKQINRILFDTKVDQPTGQNTHSFFGLSDWKQLKDLVLNAAHCSEEEYDEIYKKTERELKNIR